MRIREFTADDIKAAGELWLGTRGVCNCEKCAELDSEDKLKMFMARNPGLSFVAEQDGAIVGTALAGHDGRTGIIYRLTVLEELREKGIGKELVAKAVSALKKEGITSVKAFVLKENETGNEFWEKIGFKEAETAITRAIRI